MVLLKASSSNLRAPDSFEDAALGVILVFPSVVQRNRDRTTLYSGPYNKTELTVKIIIIITQP